MKLLIVGSQSVSNFDMSPYIPPDADTIICADVGAIGRLAEQYADFHKLSKYILRPRYDLYGNMAEIKRNELMVDMADAVLFIWDGCCIEIRYILDYAKEKNKRFALVRV